MVTIAIQPTISGTRKFYFDTQVFQLLDSQLFDPTIYAQYDAKIKETKANEQADDIKLSLYKKIVTAFAKEGDSSYFIDRIVRIDATHYRVLYLNRHQDILTTDIDLKDPKEGDGMDIETIKNGDLPTCWAFKHDVSQNEGVFARLTALEEELEKHRFEGPITFPVPQPATLPKEITTALLCETFQSLHALDNLLKLSHENAAVFQAIQSRFNDFMGSIKQNENLTHYAQQESENLFLSKWAERIRQESDKAQQFETALKNEYQQPILDLLDKQYQLNNIKHQLAYSLYQLLAAHHVGDGKDNETTERYHQLLNLILPQTEKNDIPPYQQIADRLKALSLNEIAVLINQIVSSPFNHYTLHHEKQDFTQQLSALAAELPQENAEPLFKAWEWQTPFLQFQVRAGFEWSDAALQLENTYTQNYKNIQEHFQNDHQFNLTNLNCIHQTNHYLQKLQNSINAFEQKCARQEQLLHLQTQASQLLQNADKTRMTTNVLLQSFNDDYVKCIDKIHQLADEIHHTYLDDDSKPERLRDQLQNLNELQTRLTDLQNIKLDLEKTIRDTKDSFEMKHEVVKNFDEDEVLTQLTTDQKMLKENNEALRHFLETSKIPTPSESENTDNQSATIKQITPLKMPEATLRPEPSKKALTDEPHLRSAAEVGFVGGLIISSLTAFFIPPIGLPSLVAMLIGSSILGSTIASLAARAYSGLQNTRPQNHAAYLQALPIKTKDLLEQAQNGSPSHLKHSFNTKDMKKALPEIKPANEMITEGLKNECLGDPSSQKTRLRMTKGNASDTRLMRIKEEESDTRLKETKEVESDTARQMRCRP